MNRKTSAAAALVAAIACPLIAHSQGVTVIGEGNPGAAGATRNTTGASAYNNTIRDEAAAPATVGVGAIPSTAGRSDGTGIGVNTGTTAGGGVTTGTIGNTTTGTMGTGTTGSGATSGSMGSTGSGGAAGAGGSAAGGGAAGR